MGELTAHGQVGIVQTGIPTNFLNNLTESMRLPRQILMCSALLAFAPDVQAAETCRDIDARQGWQPIMLEEGPFTNWSVSGAWTVDRHVLDPVDYRGHTGEAARQLEPFNDFKYQDLQPFGALLVSPDQGEGDAADFFFLEILMNTLFEPLIKKGDVLWFRINDSNVSLVDNAGTLTVCIEQYVD